MTTIRPNREPQPEQAAPRRPDPRDVPKRTVLVARPVAAEEPDATVLAEDGGSTSGHG